MISILSGVQDPVELRGKGTAALISRDPLIISTPYMTRRAIGIAEVIAPYIGQRPATFLIPLTWHCDAWTADQMAVVIADQRDRFPDHKFIVLGNTPEEVRLLQQAGIDAFFVNKNIHISEKIFRPLPDVAAEFDAVYNARPAPMKRHELSYLIDRILYIGAFTPFNDETHTREILANLLAKPGAILVNPIVNGLPRIIPPSTVNAWLSKAAVGLCLSEEEGAMYSSMEYLLAGLPVVSTPSRGGRDVFFDSDYCIVAEPKPQAIRHAVEALRDRNIPRDFIRARTLEKISIHRQRFLAILDSIKAHDGKKRQGDSVWTFAGAPFHQWKPIEEHVRDILGVSPTKSPTLRMRPSGSTEPLRASASVGPANPEAAENRSFLIGSPTRAPSAPRLITFIGENDSDILPFFLDHYRRLGIAHFHITLHGTWAASELESLRAADVSVADIVSEPFDDVLLTSSLDGMAGDFTGEWVLVVDADEFLELPYPSLKRTIAALECLGLDELPANLVQRAAPDGALLPLSQGAPQTLFPCYDYRLAERMATKHPVWKSKYPLVRVGPSFRFRQGNHHPSNGRPAMHVPIRGVLYHFKWRDRLLRSISRARGEAGKQQGNQEEQDAFRRWLDAHEQRLPTEGLRTAGRDEMQRAGHLVKPTRNELRVWAALRKARAGRASSIANVPHASSQRERSTNILHRKALGAPGGRIALVTTDLLGLRRTGGIGTAMTALAERLAMAGHEVHVFLVPWGNHEWSNIWAEHWTARGVTIHHLRLGAGWTLADLSLLVADALSESDWDVIHVAENDGLSAVAALMHSAGLGFQNTQFVVTAHGPTRWHRHGNFLRWSEWEALGSELEIHAIALADVLACPSEYIAEWCRQRYLTKAPPIVVPNSLTGEGRRFGRGALGRRRVNTIVFFGRIELRKGIDRFLAAIDRLLARGLSNFEVVFLGSFVSYFTLEMLQHAIQHWPCRTRILADYTSHDAQEFLRTENCISVMPSRLDNSPYVVLECLDNAVPFITTDVGGTAELIHPDDRNEALVSGDPDEIAQKLVAALQDGAAPVRPSFDPALADIDLLALHANLVEQARISRGRSQRQQSPATVIVYGPSAEIVAPPLTEWLARVGGVSIEVLVCGNVRGHGSSPLNVRTLNEAARKAAHGLLFFCHTTALPDADALSALTTTLLSTGADAAVCGYRLQQADGATSHIAAFGGPPEHSARMNIYGARLFLVQKAAFLAAGGFSDQPDIADILEWDFLNRLKAAGRKITAVPIALAGSAGRVAPNRLTESQQGALTAPWTEAAPLLLQGLARMALHSAPSTLTTPLPSFHSLGAPSGRLEEPSLFNSRDLSDDAQSRDGRLRIGPDGELRDASTTYRIETATDAVNCDFLVADGVGSADSAAFLLDAYTNLEWQLLCTDGPPAKTSFLWLHEFAAKAPSAVEPIHDLIKRALVCTSTFYEINTVLSVDSIRLRRIGAGGSILPPRRVAPCTVYPDAARAPRFAGHLIVSSRCTGGELYLTGLDIEVAPRRGRLVSIADARHYERAVLKVTSGELLVATFSMRMP